MDTPTASVAAAATPTAPTTADFQKLIDDIVAVGKQAQAKNLSGVASEIIKDAPSIISAVKAAPDLKAAASEVESGFGTSEFALGVAAIVGTMSLHVSGHDLGPALNATVGAVVAIYTLARTWRKASAPALPSATTTAVTSTTVKS